MARLDKFIQAMRDRQAEGLQLTAGQPVALLMNGVARPITRDALNTSTIHALLKEIAPPESNGALAGRFTYQADGHAVEVEVAQSTQAISALIRPAPVRDTLPAPSKANPPDLAEVLAEPAPRVSYQLQAMSEDPAGKAEIDRLLRQLAGSGASDLHLRTGESPMLRKDGELARLEQPVVSPELMRSMLASICSAKDYALFAETGDVDFAYEIAGLARFRCNGAMDRRGPMAVFRIIPNLISTVDELGLSKEVQALCMLNKGLVLVTGPTGSGKSTTLAAMVDLVNRTRSSHLITIEDPIEFVHPSKKCLVTQRQVGMHTTSFKQALRAALREDPDIVLVGEMRDLETMSIAIETAETGHLVFGTLHTTTAASTIDRIIDQFPVDRQSQVRVMLSESLQGVVSQVLCRRIGGGRSPPGRSCLPSRRCRT